MNDQDYSDESKPNRRVIKVTQADTKRLLAIKAHFKQLIRTALRKDERTFKRPIEMDQSELLLAAASLRALFFDHSPKPLLASLFDGQDLDFQIEAIETNLGLVLLSMLLPERGHISEYLAANILDPQAHDFLKLDEPRVCLIAFDDRKGLEAVIDRPEIWVPTKEQDAIINSALSHLTNAGPMQLLTLTRRRVSFRTWGKVRVGFLKHIAITRKTLIEYVANRLGGVHYDSRRKPHDPKDIEQFHALAAAMDWDDQSLMHAGLVGVGIACIEVLNTPELHGLYHECCEILSARQKRLIERGLEAMGLDPNENNVWGD